MELHLLAFEIFNHSKSINKNKCFILLILFSILSLPAFSQVNPIAEKLAGSLRLLAKNSPSELVYIQTNKGIYETGEDLWFKAYILDAQYFSPSMLSKTLYLQLVNENTKQAVWQEMYEIQKGFANGHIYIRDTLSQGSYLLEAFTQHSVYSDSTEMKALRRILVRKDMKTPPVVTADTNKITNSGNKPRRIQFTTFPEGGNLVDGIQSKLAFKAVNTDGNPLDIAGTLFEETTALFKFKSTHAGMGSLDFTPLAGKKYRIRLSEPATDSIFLLPEPVTEGITLRLAARDKENIEFVVSHSPGLNERNVYLRVQSKGIVYCIASGVLNKELVIKIPLKEFPWQGIAEFTLFNDSFVPVAERLVYIKPEKKLTIETKTDKVRYETRDKVTLKITVKDENGQPVKSNLGISVFDKLYQNLKDPNNILTHCFLSSQLKGKVYDPAYYFDNKNENREEALDLLLMTQGWRRYVWSEPALKAYNNPRQELIYDGIKGEVHTKNKQRKAQSEQYYVTIVNPEKNETASLIKADTTGVFFVSPKQLKIWQGSYVLLKPSEEKLRISLSDPFKTINEVMPVKAINYPLPSITETKKEDPFRPFAVGPNMIKLNEFTVKGKATKTFRDKYMGHLDSLAKQNYNNDYVDFHGALNCPCHTDATKYAHRKPIEGEQLIKYVEGDPCFRIIEEGHCVFCEVEHLVYHYPKYTEEELLKMNNLSRFKAYYVHREFYKPAYDTISDDNFLTDYRNTLYWAPSVTTDEKGEATLSFFCSDINTGFVGKIEGVSNEGLLGASDFEFIVRQARPINQGK